MRRSEFVAAMVFLLLGVFVVQQSTNLAYSAAYGPGAGFLPFWLGVVWIGLSLLHLVNLTLQPHLYSGAHPFPSGRGAARLAALLALLLASVFLFGLLGLLIALVGMVLVALRFIERVPWRVSIQAAVAISLGTYLLFAVVLGVPFPRGPVEILLGR